MIHYLTAAWARFMRPDSKGPNSPMPSATSYGYDIQSRVLGIPDKYGFFSQGPPRLQEFEGTLFAVLILMRIATILEEAWTIYTVECPQGKPLLPLLALNGLGHIMSIICTWGTAICVRALRRKKEQTGTVGKTLPVPISNPLGEKSYCKGSRE
ncbi:unnamed protein product [Clonostachys rhizophaga]|uniref:Uncharacterized protein n=1 Tax=Clonostachys rhizophaga TaxID=160324 RepID=A0A9N9VVV3_9HYPO|nr:unnamed protein product [Clonostachys rhizophaga]